MLSMIKGLTKSLGRSHKKELEEGPHSGLYLAIVFTTKESPSLTLHSSVKTKALDF